METEMLLEKNLLTFLDILKSENPEIEPILDECCHPLGGNKKRVSMHDWFTNLRKLEVDKLRELGVQRWTEKHWLYPSSWFEHIPDGLEILNIFGMWEKFCKDKHSPGSRFGALPYGFGEFEVGK